MPRSNHPTTIPSPVASAEEFYFGRTLVGSQKAQEWNTMMKQGMGYSDTGTLAQGVAVNRSAWLMAEVIATQVQRAGPIVEGTTSIVVGKCAINQFDRQISSCAFYPVTLL